MKSLFTIIGYACKYGGRKNKEGIKMLGITIYSTIIVVITVILCFFVWKATRSLKDVGICLFIGEGVSLIVMFSVFVRWGMALLAILVVAVFLIGIGLSNLVKSHFVLVLTVMAICLGLGVAVQVCSRCEHIVSVDYTIELKDNTIDIDYDVEDIPDEAYEKILSKVRQMRKDNEHNYEGVLKIKYSGRYPLYLEDHTERCSCTDKKVCDMCKEFIEYFVIE